MDSTAPARPPAFAQAADLTPRLKKAIAAAKIVAERQVFAVPDDLLAAAYLQVTPAERRIPGNTRLKLSIDDGTGRVVGRIFDRDTGELVHQIPSEDMLRLIARTKEMFGGLVNETV